MQPHNLRLRQRIEVQIEADDCRRSGGLHVEFVDLYREHSEQVAVRCRASEDPGRCFMTVVRP